MCAVSMKSIRYYGLYKPANPALSVYALLLAKQLETIKKNRKGAIRGDDTAHLHDIRTALRRTRRIIAFFARLPGFRNNVRVDNRLKKLCTDLGRVRDMHARLELLDQIAAGPDVNLQVYRRRFVLDINSAQSDLGNLLSSADWKYVMQAVSAIERRCRRAARLGMLMSDYAELQIAREMGACRQEGYPDVKRMSPEALHELRKRLRRLRYNAEICAPVLGACFVEMELMLKRTCNVLGRIHDIDVSLAFVLSSSDLKRAGKALAVLRKERRKSMKELTALVDRAWKALSV